MTVLAAHERDFVSGGFATTDVRGMVYNPFVKRWSWTDDLNVSYALRAVSMDIDREETKR